MKKPVSNFFFILPISMAYGTVVVIQGIPMRSQKFAVLILCCTSMVASAGVPELIHPQTGVAIGWKNPQHLPSHIDAGPLGLLTNTQARELVMALMGVWGEVADSSVAFATPTLLPIDIDASNVRDYLDDSVCADNVPARNPSMRAGESPIIFDNDGSIIDLLAGEGASKKIAGKAAYRCFAGTLDNPTAATQAFAVFNGRFFDGDNTEVEDLSINALAGVMLHELGHFLGLHHSMVNESIFADIMTGARPLADSRFIPVMYPLVFRDSTASTVLKPDDIAAISALYPTPDAALRLGSASGVIEDANRQGVRGANVVARRTDDPLCEAVSTISGRFCTPLLDEHLQMNMLGTQCRAPDLTRGAYRVEGLLPGTYTIEVSEIVADGGARKNMFPADEIRDLPGPAEYFNRSTASNDLTGAASAVVIERAAQLTNLNIILAASSASAARTMNLRPFQSVEHVPGSACREDPVDYRELMALVNHETTSDVASSQNTSEHTTTGNLAPLAAPTALSASGSGCTLQPHNRATSTNALFVKLFIVCVVAIRVSRRRRVRRCAASLGVVLCVVSSAAQATSYLPVTPTELVQSAGKIFEGTCIKARTIHDAHGFSVGEITYRVHRIIKGPMNRVVVFRMVGAQIRGGSGGDHDAQAAPFLVGSRDVIALYPESRWGYTSPVGGAQGHFHVERNASGAMFVKNPFMVSSAVAEPKNISPHTLLDRLATLLRRQGP